MSTLPDPVIRGARTFVQAFLGTFLGLVVAGNTTSTVPDYSTLKAAVIASAWAALIALISFVQNALEDTSGKTALK